MRIGDRVMDSSAESGSLPSLKGEMAESLGTRPGRPISRRVMAFLIGLGDAGAIIGAGAALLIWTPAGSDIDWRVAALILPLAVVVAIDVMQLLGAYRFSTLCKLDAALARSIGSWLVAIGIVGAVIQLSGALPDVALEWLAWWALCGAALLAASRIAIFGLIGRWRRSDRLCQIVA